MAERLFIIFKPSATKHSEVIQREGGREETVEHESDLDMMEIWSLSFLLAFPPPLVSYFAAQLINSR